MTFSLQRMQLDLIIALSCSKFRFQGNERGSVKAGAVASQCVVVCGNSTTVSWITFCDTRNESQIA